MPVAYRATVYLAAGPQPKDPEVILMREHFDTDTLMQNAKTLGGVSAIDVIRLVHRDTSFVDPEFGPIDDEMWKEDPNFHAEWLDEWEVKITEPLLE